MVEASNSNKNNGTVMDTVVPKAEPTRDVSISSSVSTPEAEAEALNRDVAQAHKRKGGRKPIYATSEERKQRNRQAQAAFRERRTEYIRHLEATIKRNEESLQSLQQSHRSAADECLMLRYKNSLLERILLEKGIDVQAELRLKAGSPGGEPVKPNFMPPKPVSALDHPAINRNPSQRLPAGIASKPEQFGISQHREAPYGIPSPQFQATPSSHASSPPHTKSPRFPYQGMMSPVGVEPRTQLLPLPRNFNQASPPVGIHHSESADSKSILPAGTAPMAPRAPAAYYPSPFQKHYDQLDQEYDAQADMVDEPDNDDPSSYTPGFSVTSGSHSIGTHGPPNFNSHAGEGGNGVYGNTNNIMGHYEPMLDADPFGLSASMHFQTPFSYEQSNTRH